MTDERSHRQWLQAELPRLVAAGVLEADAAQRITAHYAQAPLATRPGWGLVVFAVLGALLVGLGVVLLFAHNWDAWSRATRTVVSLLPVLVTQLIAGFALLRRAGNVVWSEAAATANGLGVAAAIALIGQTYHLHGDLGSYLLTCALLTVPLVYLLESTLAAAMFVVGASLWTLEADQYGFAYFALLLLIAPYLRRILRTDAAGVRLAILGWVLALGVLQAQLALLGSQGHAPVAIASLLALYWLLDLRMFGHWQGRGRRPLHVVAMWGIAGMALLLSVRDAHSSLDFLDALRSAPAPEVLLPLLLLGGALLLWALAWRTPDLEVLTYGAAPLAVLLVDLMPDETRAGFVLANLYAFALAIVTLRRGLLHNRLRTVNFALAVLSALILIRFVDSDLPYTVRAIGFIVVGVGFFAVNGYLARRRRA